MSVPADDSAAQIPASRRILITVSVMLAAVMQSLDNTIANVALPRIQGSISATQDQMAWVLTSYIVASAIMIPLSGWLAGQIGRKKVFLYSVAGFTVTSMLCGLSQSLPQIVLWRLLQGVCGAALVPMSQATLLDINPPERHARAMSAWVMGVTLGPILGPALGGWLTENYNWRWVFYINVPIGILAFLGIASAMPETKRRKSRFDFFGFSTLSVALLGFQLMLDRGQLKDWFSSPEIWIEATVAGIAFYWFVIHILTTTKPAFISTTLLKDRNFLAGNTFMFVVGMVLFATLALLPPLLQDLMNYSVVTTGFVTAPRGFGTLLAMLILGRLGRRIDARLIIGAGFALTAFSLWRMTGFDLQMDEGTVVMTGLAQGLGMGFVYVPLATVTFTTLGPALRNEGTALFSLTRNLGSSVGISFVETLFTRNSQIMHARLGEDLTIYNPQLHSQAIGGSSATMLTQLNAMVTRQAEMIAYNNDFKLMLVITLVTIPLVFLLRRPRDSNAAPVYIE